MTESMTLDSSAKFDVSKAIDEGGFSTLQNMELMLILFGALVVIGGILSLLSTLRAVNKYLNMSLDELY